MTVAAKESLGGAIGGAGRFSRANRTHGWNRLWQVPLLLIGIAAFGLGVRELVRTIRPVPFEEQLKGVESLLQSGQIPKAIEQINILGDYYKEAAEQAQLQRLAGDAHYLAQQGQPLERENFEAVEDHYKKAVEWGLAPDVQMNERWGEAALALGDAKTAVGKLEAAFALATDSEARGLVERHGRDLVAAYSESGERPKALEMIDRMLANEEERAKAAEAAGRGGGDDLEAVDARTWSLCRRIEVALGGGAAESNTALTNAITGAREALAGFKERDPAGRVLVWLGRAELERGEVAAAERDLTEARKHFMVHHLDDGRAAVLLARIAESRGDLETAGRLFEEVAFGHAGTVIWPAARLGRAEVAMMTDSKDQDQITSDYQYAISAVKQVEEGEAPVGRKPEMIVRAGVSASLAKAFVRSSNAGKLENALTYLTLQESMGDHETADMALAEATTRERLGHQFASEAVTLEDGARAEKEAAARAQFAQAADAYLRHAKLTTLHDDASGASSWRAGELLDRAGETSRAIALYERLTIQRPRDPRVPEGMLALGRLYESAGMLDKAVDVYERNIRENARTPAAYTSGVNLARCYARLADRAEKPEEKAAAIKKAEDVLLSMVQNNSDLRPEAREFRDSLIALGEIYYRSGRWSDAILRVDEVVKRYPTDAAVPRMLFLLAESYRKSALEIAEAVRADPGIVNRAELEAARGQRLLEAAGQFTRVIGMLDSQAQDAADATARTLSALDNGYLLTSYMDRAECYYQRGEYETAIKFYDQAAARFSEDVSAVEAYVQIVNAYLALKQTAQAGAAAERGLWILKRVPDSAFAARAGSGDGGQGDRSYYERLLTLGKG